MVIEFIKKLLNYPCFYFWHDLQPSGRPTTVKGNEGFYWTNHDCTKCKNQFEVMNT